MGAEQEQEPVECDRLGRPLQPHAFGRPGVKCGRSKGSRNKYPRELVLAVLNAAAKVGYDRDVLVRDKKGNPLLDKKGNCIIDESKRIKGLEPYLRRSAELYRAEYLKLIEKILRASLHHTDSPPSARTAPRRTIIAVLEDREPRLSRVGRGGCPGASV